MTMSMTCRSSAVQKSGGSAPPANCPMAASIFLSTVPWKYWRNAVCRRSVGHFSPQTWERPALLTLREQLKVARQAGRHPQQEQRSEVRQYNSEGAGWHRITGLRFGFSMVTGGAQASAGRRRAQHEAFDS